MFFFVVACSRESDDTFVRYKDKTIILYVVADNSLIHYSEKLFAGLQRCCLGNNFEDSNIILFLDNDKGASLFHASKQGLEKVLEFDQLNSVKPRNMCGVLNYVFNNYPAAETGLILWSHGSGWLPTGNTTRSFGDDDGEAIDIDDLATSINKKLDYIIFDACYMGCIEVVTELADRTDYFIASPDVVPVEGVVDTFSVNTLNGKGPLEDRLKMLCEYYSKNKFEKTLPIALVKMAGLNSVIHYCSSLPANHYEQEVYYYRYRTNNLFYDLGSFLRREGENRGSEIFDEFVVFHTDSISDVLCVSVFLPNITNYNYHKYYSRTKWNRMTMWLRKFGYDR